MKFAKSKNTYFFTSKQGDLHPLEKLNAKVLHLSTVKTDNSRCTEERALPEWKAEKQRLDLLLQQRMVELGELQAERSKMLSDREKQYVEMQQMTVEIGTLKAGETTVKTFFRSRYDHG